MKRIESKDKEFAEAKARIASISINVISVEEQEEAINKLKEDLQSLPLYSFRRANQTTHRTE